MSFALTRFTRAVIAATAVLLVLGLGAASLADAAGKRSPRAERALKRAAVHKYGVGTKVTTRCETVKGVRGWRCAWAAQPRRKSTVFAGRATVNRRMRVRFGRVVCVGAGCKK
jgi:hypothetical protein